MSITWLEALTTMIEGLITFISPCVLPMIPVYVLYFTGAAEGRQAKRTLARALCFVLGFAALFVLLGVFAGTLGALLVRWQRAVHAVCGLVMIVFGLHYAGLLRIALLNRTVKPDVRVQPRGYASCALLGAVFAVGWTPCTGPLLGSAMMLAAGKGSVPAGAVLLACYSLGLGLPFVLCALLIDRLKGALAVVKRHYRAVNRVCGVFLILVGLAMMTGLYGSFSQMLQSAATATVTDTQQVPAETVMVTTEPTAAPTAEPTAEAGKQAEVMGPVRRSMAPDFTCYDDAGNAVALSDMRGKPVVVNFFASWCGPCKMEMPYFDECYAEYGDRVTFMMVNLCAFGNDTKENGKQMVESGGWTFPVYFDTDGEAATTYAIRAMPTTILVSAEGELKGRHTGMMDRETLEKTVRAMIGEDLSE